MIGAVVYNLIEFTNYYLTYRIIMNIHFTSKRWPYFLLVGISCVIQIVVYCSVDNTWRDIITIVMGLLATIVLSKSKKWKVILGYPGILFLSSLINTIGSFIIAALLGISQRKFCESDFLVCVAECTGIVILLIYRRVRGRQNTEPIHFTVGQYILLLIGCSCLFTIIAFSQGLFKNEIEYWENIKRQAMIASILLAICFVLLSLSLQRTWRKSFRYKMENEKYDLFLTQQEKHIRMLITEDEKLRKLRHDMNAHMLALDTMIQNEEWIELRQYFSQMRQSLGEKSVENYTNISAVDAIIGEWHQKALENQVLWSWEGNYIHRGEVTIFELCTIFSNLLCNAIEAAEKVEQEKRIQVNVTSFHGKIVISIGNTCEKQLNIKSRPVSSKKDEVFHGFGLRNVEAIVNKHKGNIEYSGQDGWFQVDIVL